MAKENKSNSSTHSTKDQGGEQGRTAKTQNETDVSEDQGAPVCEKCGSLKIEEDKELVCPHCQGEIDFLGDDDDE